MTNKDLTTILKAGYVIITPAGQTQENLGLLQEYANQCFGDIMNQSHVEIARDKMSNTEMIENLPVMAMDGISRSSVFLESLVYSMDHPKSKSYGEEIHNLMLSDDGFIPSLYPNLNSLLKVENNVGKVLGKGGFFSKWF